MFYVRNCRGTFRCDNGPVVRCGFPPGLPAYSCSCGLEDRRPGTQTRPRCKTAQCALASLADDKLLRTPGDGPSECPRWLDEYARWHRANRGAPHAEYLVYTCRA